MDIMELGAIGELVGGVAVLVTLGYLAIQIRQNTASNRFLATQSLVEGHAEANLMLSTHEDLATILQMGMLGGREALEPSAQLRLNTWLMGLWSQVEFAYFQYQAAQLDERIWNRMEYEIETFLSLPGLSQWWDQDKERFSPDFIELVDRKLAAAHPPEIRPTVGQPREGSSGTEGL